MSLKDLDQALFESKWGDAEEDALDIVARVVELPRAAVERVLYAASLLRKRDRFTQLSDYMDTGNTLDAELRDAIVDAVDRGRRRAVTRYAIQNDSCLYVPVKRLIGKDYGRICNGCPFSIDCAVLSMRTPRRCVKSGPPARFNGPRTDGAYDIMVEGQGGAKVYPQWIRGDAILVSCSHPKGEWTIDIMDIKL